MKKAYLFILCMLSTGVSHAMEDREEPDEQMEFLMQDESQLNQVALQDLLSRIPVKEHDAFRQRLERFSLAEQSELLAQMMTRGKKREKSKNYELAQLYQLLVDAENKRLEIAQQSLASQEASGKTAEEALKTQKRTSVRNAIGAGVSTTLAVILGLFNIAQALEWI